MPFGPSSRAVDCARARSANFGDAKAARAAADRTGRAREDDRPASLSQHGCCRSPTDKKSGEATGTPGLLEQILGNLENASSIPDADIEDDQGWLPEFISNALENVPDLLTKRRIAGIPPNQNAMRVVCKASSRDCGDPHAGLRAASDKSIAQSRSCANNHGNFRCAHFALRRLVGDQLFDFT
jgi:hypothetical protein